MSSNDTMIDIFVNGGKIDQVSASGGTVINVDEHSSAIVLSGCWDIWKKGNGTHMKQWIIAIVCFIIMIIVGWLMYEIIIVRRQNTQIKRLEVVLQNQETRLLELEEQMKQQEAKMYKPDEMKVDSIGKQS